MRLVTRPPEPTPTQMIARLNVLAVDVTLLREEVMRLNPEEPKEALLRRINKIYEAHQEVTRAKDQVDEVIRELMPGWIDDK